MPPFAHQPTLFPVAPSAPEVAPSAPEMAPSAPGVGPSAPVPPLTEELAEPPTAEAAPPPTDELAAPPPAVPATPPTAEPPVHEGVLVSGILLRSVLVLAIRHAGNATVSDLVRHLERNRLRTTGRTSKDVSDALRWEVRRGRVRRVARGTYAIGHLPRTTAWRMRNRVRDHLARARTGTPSGRDPAAGPAPTT